ncbi:MAG: DUF6152 family protein [Steroidobacteraceae bacterium]
MKLIQTALVIVGLVTGLVTNSYAAQAAKPAQQLDDVVILEGTVKNVDWSGEQLVVVLYVNDGWDRPDWTITGPKPSMLLAMGWSKDLLKVNDRLSAYAYPDKSGALKATLKRFALEDGTTLEASLKSDMEMAPRAAFNRVFENPIDDPMSGFYTNTRTCLAQGTAPSAKYNCTSWWNPDHSVAVFENNIGNEGGVGRGVGSGMVMQTGIWWLQMARAGQWTNCQLMTGMVKPRCHSPTTPGKAGDKWSIEFTGRDANWTEHRSVMEGRR